MPPEHLRALALGSSEGVDCRADIYGLGVVLFESLTGKRPYASPRRGGSIVDLLNRAAADRMRMPPRLRDRHPEIPRASRDGDQTLPGARAARPLSASVVHWRPTSRPSPTTLPLPSHSRAVAAPHPRVGSPPARPDRRGVDCSPGRVSALLAGGIGLRVERANLLRQASLEFDAGQQALDRGDFSAAKARFDATAGLAKRSTSTPWSYLARFNDFRHIGGQLSSKFEDFKSVETPENLGALGGREIQAGRTDRTRAQEGRRAVSGRRSSSLPAAARRRAAELTQATVDLQEVLAPFFVLENPDWTKLTHTMPLLDADRRARLDERRQRAALPLDGGNRRVGRRSAPALNRGTSVERKRRTAGTGACALREGTRLGSIPRRPGWRSQARLRAARPWPAARPLGAKPGPALRAL